MGIWHFETQFDYTTRRIACTTVSSEHRSYAAGCLPTAQPSRYLRPALDGYGYADGVQVLSVQYGVGNGFRVHSGQWALGIQQRMALLAWIERHGGVRGGVWSSSPSSSSCIPLTYLMCILRRALEYTALNVNALVHAS